MNIIRDLRKKKGIQQKELADKIGVSRPTVSEWESQKKDPSGERLKRLSAFFGVDELVILGQTDNAQTNEARIIAAGIDRMTEPERKHAIRILKAVFEQYKEFFDEGK